MWFSSGSSSAQRNSGTYQRESGARFLGRRFLYPSLEEIGKGDLELDIVE